MKPWYASPSLYLTLLATLLGSVAAMQGLPGSVTQIAGLLGAIIAPMALAAQRTVLAHQDSAEAHALQLASLAVVVPDAGAAKTDPTVKPATGVTAGVASAAKGILLCLLASSMMSCAGYVAHARPQMQMTEPQAVNAPMASIVVTDAQCSSWVTQQNACQIASASLGVIGGGSGLAAAFPDQASHRDLLGGIGLGLSAVGAGLQVWCHNLAIDLQSFCDITPVTP